MRATLLATLLFVGCASTQNPNLQVSEPLQWRADVALAAVEATPDTAAPDVAAAPSYSLDTETSAVAETYLATSSFDPIAQEESLHGSRFTIKAGYYSSEDADELDDGYIVNGSWMRFFSKLLALEVEVGYFDADGEDGAVEAEVWGIPIMLNGRLNVPIWVLDLYGGLGLGTIYYDVEVSAGNQSADDDGFLWAGNAFLGTSLNLAEAISLGLEVKYYVTEDINEFDSSLDAFAVMLTLGFSR